MGTMNLFVWPSLVGEMSPPSTPVSKGGRVWSPLGLTFLPLLLCSLEESFCVTLLAFVPSNLFWDPSAQLTFPALHGVEVGRGRKKIRKLILVQVRPAACGSSWTSGEMHHGTPTAQRQESGTQEPRSCHQKYTENRVWRYEDSRPKRSPSMGRDPAAGSFPHAGSRESPRRAHLC